MLQPESIGERLIEHRPFRPGSDPGNPDRWPARSAGVAQGLSASGWPGPTMSSKGVSKSRSTRMPAGIWRRGQGAERCVDVPVEHGAGGLRGVLVVESHRVQAHFRMRAVESVNRLGRGDSPVEDVHP